MPRPAARFEIQFLKNMIDHHASAVELTALCPGRTAHNDLLQLCQDMHEAQLGEIDMMQSVAHGLVRHFPRASADPL